MILVIEDQPQRIKEFRRAFGTGIGIAMTAAAAIGRLRNGSYRRVYLDYDGVDGERLARLIVAENLQPGADIIIHSRNYYGARLMLEILQGRGAVLGDYDEIVGNDER